MNMLEYRLQEAGSPSAIAEALPPPSQPVAAAPPKGSSREPETGAPGDDNWKEATGQQDYHLEDAAAPQELRDARERCLKVRGALASEIPATDIAENMSRCEHAHAAIDELDGGMVVASLTQSVRRDTCIENNGGP